MKSVKVATGSWETAESLGNDERLCPQRKIMTDSTWKPPQMKWSGETLNRFWRWQAGYPTHYFTNKFGNRIASHLAPHLRGHRSVVDYGCGPGFLLRHLVALGLEVAATDTSSEALTTAQDRNAGLKGFLGATPARELIATGKTFDAAVAIEVIEHLDDSSLDEFFTNVKHLVRPGGRAIITTPNEEDLEEAAVYCPHCDHSFHRYQHLRSWSAETLAATIEANGFIVDRTYTTDFSKRPFGDPVSSLKRLVKRVLGRPEKRPHLVCITRLPS